MRRVQFTSDLLPSDVLGVSVFDQRTSEFVPRHGRSSRTCCWPTRSTIASPRTQSALLEAMSDEQESLIRRQDAPAARALSGRRHPKSSGFRRDFPVARIPARPLHDAYSHRLSAAPGRDAPDAGAGPRPHPERAGRARSTEHSLLSLQREVDRVTTDSALGAYLQALITATRDSPVLSLGASTRAGMKLVARARCARKRSLLNGR